MNLSEREWTVLNVLWETNGAELGETGISQSPGGKAVRHGAGLPDSEHEHSEGSRSPGADSEADGLPER